MVVTGLLIVAAVAVLAGIAVVSTGYGGELAPADPSRAGLHLPTTRTLTPADLECVRLSTGFWGHPPKEVEEVLDRVAESLAERDAHIADLERRLLTRQITGEGPGQTPRPARPDDADGLDEESW